MAAKNTTPTVFDRIQSGELISIPAAMKQLDITSAGAFQAALKSHDYLKAAIVEKTDLHKRLIEAAAVERYMNERGNRGGSRDGSKWYNIRVTDEQAEELRAQGFEIVKPTDRAKKAAGTNGVNAEPVSTDAEPVGSHYLEGDDDESGEDDFFMVSDEG